MPKRRLLTDTCSVFMLLGCGTKLFKKGILTKGDLIIHPQVLDETKKWPKSKRDKYSLEYALLHHQLGATVGLKVPRFELNTYFSMIEAAEIAVERSIGYSDKLQLATVLHAVDIDLVTNDGPFTIVTGAFQKKVYCAEEILLEALEEGIITKFEAQRLVSKWLQNDEPIKKANRPLLRRKGIKL